MDVTKKDSQRSVSLRLWANNVQTVCDQISAWYTESLTIFFNPSIFFYGQLIRKL